MWARAARRQFGPTLLVLLHSVIHLYSRGPSLCKAGPSRQARRCDELTGPGRQRSAPCLPTLLSDLPTLRMISSDRTIAGISVRRDTTYMHSNVAELNDAPNIACEVCQVLLGGDSSDQSCFDALSVYQDRDV